MTTTDTKFDELCEECEQWFGFKVLDAKPIVRGWLNRKWKLTTTHGVFLLKCYDPDRYRMYDEAALVKALRWQSELHKKGLPCPRILSHDEAELQMTPSGQRYMVMSFCAGQRMLPGKATVGEMYSLGVATGQMHDLLLTLGDVPTKPTFSIPAVSERVEHWTGILGRMEADGKQELSPFAERQLSATQDIDIDDFESVEIGWAHRDLWADNILVADDRLSAILDFDRLKNDYVELDMARAIMSGALDGDELNITAIQAFLDGYRTQRDFPKGRILRSLRMLWYMESSWWITPNMDKHTVPPQRFAHEMDWLARHIGALPSILGAC
ncbi:phosphotransferase [Alicyclobacillus mengziensis]|uniref:Phosphotransferase n=1 Tax=Alicyclobacillus mengziensis TaxID=2931921 RepID=A0A9X7Z5V6_9BACL|nr:phosphotransferase [Alicyclobacillus mengziensis]QSO45650.1 phosphotransferase [Alicyclobacillus mengziensis]